MRKTPKKSVRHPVPWIVLSCLALLVFALAACGSETTSSDTNPASNGVSNSTNGNTMPNGNTTTNGNTTPYGNTSTGNTTPTGNTTTNGDTTPTGNTPTSETKSIAIKETKAADGKDVYKFDPSSITVQKGETITIKNSSDQQQNIDKGDAVKAGVTIAVAPDHTSKVTFNTPGTFAIKSDKGATLTVIVQ